MGAIDGDGRAVTGLGGTAGYGETALARGDDTVTCVDVSAVFSAGFSLGGISYGGNQVFISTDGIVIFGTGQVGVAAPPAPFLAIFNADIDTRLDGEGAESGAVWLDVDTVQDCVTITWDHVGFYRRNASLTNTFQMQLFDRGDGNFDVVYRYQDINWTSGNLQGGWDGLGGTAAMIGTRAASGGAAVLLPASGNEAAQLRLDSTVGNTGVKGLWVIPFNSASVIVGTAGADRLQGTDAPDTIRGLEGDDVLPGSKGADLMDGGQGVDCADYTAARQAILIDLDNPAAQNRGQAAGDRYLGIELYLGSALADTLCGSDGADNFAGGKGRDRLVGQNGDDILAGGDGNDVLSGGLGNDRLVGGKGVDVLTGGGGG